MKSPQERSVSSLTEKNSDSEILPEDAGNHTSAMKHPVAEDPSSGSVFPQLNLSREFLLFSQFSLDHMADAAYWISPEGSFSYVNQAACRLLGYSGEDLLKMRVTDVAIGEYSLHWSEHWQELKSAGALFFESFHLTHDAKTLPVEIQAYYMAFGGREFNCCFVRDISEKKRVEAVLTDTLFYFRESQRIGSIGSYKTDFVTGFWESSEVLDTIFGIDENYVKSIPGWLDIVYPDDREMMAGYLAEEVLRRKKPFDKEYRIQRICDGEIRWVHGKGESYHSADNRPLSLIGTIQDITERKKIELTLVESEEKWRLLVETIPDYVAIFDPEGHYLYLNHFAAGFSEKDILGKHYTDLLLAEAKPDYSEAFEKAKKTCKTQHASYLGYGDNFGQLYYEADMVPLFTNGLFTNMMVIARDITERKKAEEALRLSEERYRSVVKTSPDGIALSSLEGEVYEVSDRLLSMFGFTSAMEMTGKSIFDFIDPAEQENSRRGLANLLSGINNGQKEYRVIHKDGTRFHVESNLAVLQHANNAATGLIHVVRNITGRKKAEEALKESEEKFSKAFRNSPDIIILSSFPEGKIVEVNDNIFTLAGYSIEEVIGKSTVELNFWTNQTDRKRFIDEMQSNGRAQNIETTFRKKSGESVPALISGEIISLRDSNYILSIVHDISGLKKAEEALRQSEQRWKTIVNTSPDGIAITTMEGTLTQVSDKILEMFGYDSFSELQDKNMIEFVHPEYHEKARTELGLKMSGNGRGASDYQVIRKDSSTFFVEINVALYYSSEGEATHLIHVIRDISARKLAEEELQESRLSYKGLFNTVTEAIYIQDENGIFIDVNAGVEKMYGYTREELLGKTPEFLSAPGKNDLQAILKLVGTVFLSGVPAQFEFWGKRKNGEEFPKEVICHKGINFGTEVIITTARDITQRKQAELKLRDSEVRLIELNATKDKFFSIISHDMKSAFNSILGFSSLLEERVKEQDYEGIEEFAFIIQNSSQRALELLKNLLEWSRSQTGRMEFLPEYLDLVALINELVVFTDDFARQKSITISWELPRYLPVFADKAMVSTILRNLLSNAVKFTASGGTIYVTAVQKPGEVMVSIADSGVGMSQEALGKLFRIDGSFTTSGTQNEKGTGLGLILCREFIEKHQGKIWAESESGKGSTFRFTIPKT